MTNRREFLQIGITASAWPLASAAVRAADIQTTEPLSLYKVIYDRRFPESVAFAERARSLGLSVRAIEGDMTRFWYDELYHEWKKGPAAIAGLTAHGPMFCFEQLARDQSLRVVFRAEHRFGARGAVEHALTGPLTMLSESLALNERGAQWASCMAEVVAHCPQGRAEMSQATGATVAGARAPSADAESLYSWVIAPAVKV
jgi:hypothetical protein